MPRSAPAIAMHGIGKRFGSRWVLRGVTADVQPGEAVGLIGANGSGKSTLLRVLATLLKPNVGTATLDGRDVLSDANGVRECTGYLAHTAGIYDDLTARENLLFAADMLGRPHTSVDEILRDVGLAPVARHRARGFSAGMQRRLALGRLRLVAPRVLLLDEPYSNLDADGILLMNATIHECLRAGGAALIALHELAPARGVIARTVALVDGRIEQPARDGVEREIPHEVSGVR